jgi:hypothetical protein
MSDERPKLDDRRAGWSYCGEAWTDVDGRATVALPPAAGVRRPGFAYEFATADPGVTAELVEELHDGFFVLATDLPHSKVAWRLTALEHSNPPTTPGGTP